MIPAKIKVCHCEQCKAIKNKRKNRKSKKIIKRSMNKQRRNKNDCYISYYWA